MWYTDFPRPRPLHFNYFSPFSFAVTVGNIINVLSHTPSSLHFPRFRKARQPVFHLSFNSWPLYSFFCLFGVFFQLCERMLGWLEGKDLVKWQWEDRSADSQTDWHTWVTVVLFSAFHPTAFLPRPVTLTHLSTHKQKLGWYKTSGDITKP